MLLYLGHIKATISSLSVSDYNCQFPVHDTKTWADTAKIEES